jgi:hypothetical protein
MAAEILRSAVFTGPHTNKGLAWSFYTKRPYEYDSEASAKDACIARTDCNGVTQEPIYTLRSGLNLDDSSRGEVSWQKDGTSFTGPNTNKYIAYYTSGTYLFTSETLAKDACKVRTDCKGVTREPGTRYTLRQGATLHDTVSGEVSWQKGTEILQYSNGGTGSALVHKVRVQLDGTNHLHLREVQVFDTSGVNRALNKPATQSSTYDGHHWGPDPASKAVNGNLNDFSSTKNDVGMYHEWTKSNLFVYSTLSFKPLDPLSLTLVVCRRLVGGGFGRGC